jgi:hypothetical protein
MLLMKTIIIRVKDEEVKFYANKILEFSSNDQIIYKIDEIDTYMTKEFEKMTCDEKVYLAEEDTDTLTKSPNIKLKLLSSFLHYKFLGPDETYPLM